MPYPIFYKDRRGRYLGCNHAFEHFHGMSRVQIAGKTVHEIAPKELADRSCSADEELFAHPGTRLYEASMQSADGTQRDVIFHKATFKGPQGSVAGIVGAIVDISERKRDERDRQALQTQLAHAQKMESVGRLAGGVAHDINNMLTIIIGHAEMASDRLQPSDPTSGHLREIVAAASRSANVVRQLLAFARRQNIAPKILNFNDAVEGAVRMLRSLIGENIDLAWKPGSGVGMVRMDPSQIDQLLANLTVNARDAIRDAGKIIIESAVVEVDAAYCRTHADTSPGSYVLLSVSDDGCGMDKETLANVFDPFFTTKESGKGTGLGLAMVYGIVKQNGGFINAYSEPGQGSTFNIYIPQSQSEEASTADTGASEGEQTGDETVLLVEDEEGILKLVETELASLGYTVLTARTPDEALRLAETHGRAIHLLMTDVIMPGMNGRELLRCLLPLHPKLKHLFMSGYTANVIAHHGVLDEGVHFIHKPFSRRDMAIKVREALGS